MERPRPRPLPGSRPWAAALPPLYLSSVLLRAAALSRAGLSLSARLVREGLVVRRLSAGRLVRQLVLSRRLALRPAAAADRLRVGAGRRRRHPGRYLERSGSERLARSLLVIRQRPGEGAEERSSAPFSCASRGFFHPVMAKPRTSA